MLKSTFNAENYICSLSLSPVITAQKFTETPLFWGFKVFQKHQCWYLWKARQQCTEHRFKDI